MKEEKMIRDSEKYLLNRKLKVLIANDEKIEVDEIISKLDVNNEDYEIIGYALSNEEERRKIKELKPDIVITDIFRGSFARVLNTFECIKIWKALKMLYFFVKFSQKTIA